MAYRLRTLGLALRIGASASVLALAATSAYAQEVTGTIRGDVQDDAGNPLAGATVIVTHVPSGTRSVQTTDGSGTFSAPNLRIGGPFDIEVQAPGFERAQATISTLAAGQPQRVTVFLVPEGQTIEVIAGRIARSSVALSSGPATILNAGDIAGVSTINRDVRQLANRDPFVTLDPTNGTGAISVAGTNNRFNRISVDGIAFGDPFGLEAGGLASARGPVPLDAICEFSVEVAPVDIQQGGFQGGAVNSVLCSGDNRWKFTGFYSYTADELAGKRTRSRRVERDFESKIWGVQARGPIIPDRLFLAVTYERTDNSTPTDVGIPGEGFANVIPVISRAQVEAVRGVAQSVYRYDALDIAKAVEEKDQKLAVKLDWNLTDSHRVAATYIYAKGNILAGQTPLSQASVSTPNFSPVLSLQSNNYDQGSINHYGVLQINSDWTSSFSTQLRATYNDYRRLQVPFNGREFGQFQVCLSPGPTTVLTNCANGVGRINFGPDISRQANELFTQTFGLEFQGRIRQNNHDVKIIVERREREYNNLFAQRVSGAWRFDSFADFEARRANELDIAIPTAGTIDSVRALFDNIVWTFGVQDTWDVTNSLTLTYGFRYDLYQAGATPQFNQAFLDRHGFANTSTLNGRYALQPRFSANWRATDRLQLEATAGLYAGGSPDVWISNNYSNPGPTLNRIQVRRSPTIIGGVPVSPFTITNVPGLTPAQITELGALTLNNVSGGPGVPQALVNVVRAAGSALAPTNALDPNFEIPSIWRLSGSADYTANLGPLGDDWNFGLDVVWSRTKQGLDWTDIRSVRNVVQSVLPDGRPRYQAQAANSGNNFDMLLTNDSRGFSWNIVGRFNKRFDNGFDIGAAYTWQRVKDVNSGTSSVALSNYNQTATNDPNFAGYGTSIYQRDNSLRLNLGFQREFFGDNATRFDFFFNSISGQRFSYTMTDGVLNAAGNVVSRDAAVRSAIFGVQGQNNRHLLYVPNVSSPTADPIVTYAAGFNFAAFQSFIQNSELSRYQGRIAPKNIGRSPRFEKLDLRISQEVPFVLDGKIQVFADFENVLNMLNKNWGSLRQVSFPYFASLVQVTCPAPTPTAPNAIITTPAQACTQYRYQNFQQPNQTLFSNISLWQVRVGARISF